MLLPIYNTTLNPDRRMNNARLFSVSCSCLPVITGSTGKGIFPSFFMQRQISGCMDFLSPGVGLCAKTIVTLVFFQPRYLRQFPIQCRHSFLSGPASRYETSPPLFQASSHSWFFLFVFCIISQFSQKGYPCSPWNNRYSPQNTQGKPVGSDYTGQIY